MALNALGIATTQSCEGHLNWGVPYPWIHIESDLAQKFRLHQLLAQFYQERPVNFECALVFNGYRMFSRVAVFSELIPKAEHQQRLQIYQVEMSAFTAYLKTLIEA